MVITARTIRPGYRKMERWTVAEAASAAGRSTRTIERWLRGHANGRRRFATDPGAFGPAKIVAESFLLYLKTGEPQGPAVAVEGNPDAARTAQAESRDD